MKDLKETFDKIEAETSEITEVVCYVKMTAALSDIEYIKEGIMNYASLDVMVVEAPKGKDYIRVV